MRTCSTLLVLFAIGISAPAGHAAMAYLVQDFMHAGDVFSWEASLLIDETLVAMSTPLDDNAPDTMLGTFDPFGSLVSFNDDDDGDYFGGSFSYASAVRTYAPEGDSLTLKLTGYYDIDFDGSHDESGDFALTYALVPSSLGGDFDDSAGNGSAASADTLDIGGGQAAVARNSLEYTGDVDFYSVYLRSGDILNAMTAPLADFPDYPDTMLGLFDTDGTTLLVANDDGGSSDTDDETDYGSVLRFVAPADGIYYLAATGYADDQFIGDHTETGDYGLAVSIIPEPASALLLVLGAGFALKRRRA